MKKTNLKEINQQFRKYYLSKKTKVLDKIIEYKEE
jgi:hypothetical protein